MNIPQTIQVPVYYHIADNGRPIFDIELMEEYFAQELDKLDNQEYATDKIHVCTHFLGTIADVDDFTFEWMSLLGSPVTAELKKDSMGAVKAWYCEAFVTKDQIESFDMKSDWIINN
jgi:hypothetical protein